MISVAFPTLTTNHTSPLLLTQPAVGSCAFYLPIFKTAKKLRAGRTHPDIRTVLRWVRSGKMLAIISNVFRASAQRNVSAVFS